MIQIFHSKSINNFLNQSLIQFKIKALTKYKNKSDEKRIWQNYTIKSMFWRIIQNRWIVKIFTSNQFYNEILLKPTISWHLTKRNEIIPRWFVDILLGIYHRFEWSFDIISVLGSFLKKSFRKICLVNVLNLNAL